jgi:hypothetical protein
MKAKESRTMDILQNIFKGGNPDNYEQRHQQYQQGYQNGQGRFEDLDDNDVFDRYQRTVQHAPPDLVAQAHEEAFNRLPPQEQQRIIEQFQRANNDPNQPFQYPGFNQGQGQFGPRDMGSMVKQAQRQQPDLLGQVLGPGGALSSPMGKMAMAGVAAMVASKLMGAPGSGGGLMGGQQGGLGGLLGGLGGDRRQ